MLELLQQEIDEQEEKLSQMEAREEEERAEKMRNSKARQGLVEQGAQEKFPGSTCSLPPDAGTCTTASLQRFWFIQPAR